MVLMAQVGGRTENACGNAEMRRRREERREKREE
jgi:hypothetical protein